MSASPWLHVVGIGDDGLTGLAPGPLSLVENADTIVGGARHLEMVSALHTDKIAWPSPFDALTERLRGLKGQSVVVLVSGDPLWYSAGVTLAQAFAPEDIAFHPHVSSFQLAAAQLGWRLSDVAKITLHGRPASLLRARLAPGQRILALSGGSNTAREVAQILRDEGYGGSTLHVLAHMGGPDEAQFSELAENWDRDVPDFHTLAIDCVAGPDARILPRTGLPDDVFEHDGKMTKSEVRAITLAALAPQPGALLWDIGAGCGSVGIEWMRAAEGARCIALEPQETRRAMAARNAEALGVPGLDLRAETAPDGLTDLPQPVAVFIGGGLTSNVIDSALDALGHHGRLVANAVTLEGEAILATAQATHGGTLRRLSVARAEPVGALTGWKPMMPITQWSITK